MKRGLHFREYAMVTGYLDPSPMYMVIAKHLDIKVLPKLMLFHIYNHLVCVG